MNPEAALKRVVAGCRKGFIVVGLFSLAINLLMLTVPIYMMQMYDRVISSGNVDTLVLLSIIAVGGLLAMSLVEMMRSRIMVKLGTWVDRELSGPVLSGAMNDSLRAGGLNGASGLRELNTLRGFLTGAGIFPLLDAPWVPIFVGIIFMIHPTLGMLAVVGAVIVFCFALANDFSTRKPLKQANGAAAKALYRADAMVRNADVAAAMGMEPHLVRRWRESNEEGLTLQAVASDRAGGISAMAKFVRLILQIAMLGVGAYLVTQNELTGGGMIAGSIILSRAMAPIEQSIGAWRGMVGAKGAYESIKSLLGRTPATGEAMSLPKPSGHISIEGVAFVPPGAQEPILRSVTCEILPGDTVGLIGPSASGKTTLARVMVGSWRPTAGHARLDGADVFVWDAADRGRYIGYMPQDVELFDGPVRENIARMGEPDGDAVVAAAQLAGVHDLILHLPDGYETFIGDGGAKLSGGQRQRIALARALYGDPSLVVLDEPNSNLDTEGERALMEAMTELRRRRITTVVVAHRPTILASVDKLIVLNQGRVEMAGPRDEVLEKVAPGSIDAVRRAIAANPDDAAYAPGTGPKTQPQGQPGAAGPSPGGTVSDAAPAPQGSPAAAPVMRIRPGGGAGRAKAPAPEAASTPDSATAAPSTAEPKQQPTPSAPVQAKAPGNRAEPEPSIRVGPAEAEKPAPVDPVAQPVRPVIATPEPAAEPASSAPQPSNADREKAVASLVSKITAESPPVQPTPAPAAAPVRYSASVPEEAPDTNKGSARQEKPKRSLHKSPTTPGRLFPTPVSAMTVDAQGERFTPRQSRKESDNGASRT